MKINIETEILSKEDKTRIKTVLYPFLLLFKLGVSILQNMFFVASWFIILIGYVAALSSVIILLGSIGISLFNISNGLGAMLSSLGIGIFISGFAFPMLYLTRYIQSRLILVTNKYKELKSEKKEENYE